MEILAESSQQQESVELGEIPDFAEDRYYKRPFSSNGKVSAARWVVDYTDLRSEIT
jgi:hypothetical protein